MHDLLVVLLQHHRMTVSENTGFWKDVDRELSVDGLHASLKLPGTRHPLGRVIPDDIENRDLRQDVEFIVVDLIERAGAVLERKDGLDLVGSRNSRLVDD